ncbi:translational GTPase TypA [bacterium]|nr:translational GTPase TypA [bacterium]
MSFVRNDKIRNVAIIAHVDHGKTTLVDAMFKQSGVFRDDEIVNERVMDNMDLERERGITIAAKNCSIVWKGVKINIIDTPGHADFGGEVERALSMADSAILLVDASEGPLPQTRFVLRKALEAKLQLMVVINKIDRKDARPNEVLDEIYNLFIDLGADEDQLEFPVLYAIGRDGIAQETLTEQGKDLHILMDKIVECTKGPEYDPEKPFQMLVTDLSYNDYLGRLAIGKVINGSVHCNQSLVCIKENDRQVRLKVTRLQQYQGVKLAEADRVEPGDIIILAGIEDVNIGDTVATIEAPVALPRIKVDEPTVSMIFTINNGPLAGREGKYVQLRKIKERLHKETLMNVSIKLEEPENNEYVVVKGRGELQMAIIIEQMRREGFELCVGRPTVIYKEIDGKTYEPIEHVYIECHEMFTGIVTEKLSMRKGRMLNLASAAGERAYMEFSVPSRGLIGYRDQFLTDTKGTGTLNSMFEGYEEYRGNFLVRFTGSIVADRQGEAIAYALFNLEPRGELFIVPGMPVYEGMIIGEHSKDLDIDVNPCKAKKLTNMRAAGKDDAVTLTPVKPMTLERAIHFINEDELVEVTPTSLRLRKSVLSAALRHAIRGKEYTESLKNS